MEYRYQFQGRGNSFGYLLVKGLSCPSAVLVWASATELLASHYGITGTKVHVDVDCFHTYGHERANTEYRPT
jgi:hypothetical protein